jgi:hypothetical protein
MFSFRAEGFSGTLDVLYGGLGIANFDQKIKTFSAVNIFSPIFGHQSLGSGSGSELTKNVESGSAMKPMRICNTKVELEVRQPVVAIGFY